MKKFALLLITLTILSSNLSANDQAPAYEKNYISSLKHHNQGVVESAIVQLILIKMQHPQSRMKIVEKELYELINNGPTISIRYKAFAALLLFQNPNRVNFQWDINDNSTAAFEKVNVYLDQQLLSLQGMPLTVSQ